MAASPLNRLGRDLERGSLGPVSRGFRCVILRRLESRRRHRTLRDLGLARGANDGDPANPDAARSLPGMMRVLGINPSAAALLFPNVVGALAAVCGQCREAVRCRRWLYGADRDSVACRDFCPNSDRLETLRDLL